MRARIRQQFGGLLQKISGRKHYGLWIDPVSLTQQHAGLDAGLRAKNGPMWRMPAEYLRIGHEISTLMAQDSWISFKW